MLRRILGSTQRLAIVTLSILLTVSLHSLAGGPTFGAEFEFTNLEMMDAPSTQESGLSDARLEDQMKTRFGERLRAKCADCKITEINGKWRSVEVRVELPGGFWFKVSQDPGVVEIMTKPADRAELRANQKRLDDLIFATARELGLTATHPEQTMAGHFNFGLRAAFGDSAGLFLRYFVDYANHPFLALGGLGHDVFNAPPLAMLDEAQQRELERLIRDFEKKPKTWGVKDIGERILRDVYPRSVDPEVRHAGHHYQAFSVKRIRELQAKNDIPGELRAIYAQENMEAFILMAELFEARVRLLARAEGPIVYAPPGSVDYSDRSLVELTEKYVTEAGLDFERFRPLLRADLRNAKGLGARSCRRLFAAP